MPEALILWVALCLAMGIAYALIVLIWGADMDDPADAADAEVDL